VSRNAEEQKRFYCLYFSCPFLLITHHSVFVWWRPHLESIKLVDLQSVTTEIILHLTAFSRPLNLVPEVVLQGTSHHRQRSGIFSAAKHTLKWLKPQNFSQLFVTDVLGISLTQSKKNNLTCLIHLTSLSILQSQQGENVEFIIYLTLDLWKQVFQNALFSKSSSVWLIMSCW